MDALCSQNEEKIFSVGFSYNSVVYANTDIHPLDDISVHVILSATLLPFLQLFDKIFSKTSGRWATCYQQFRHADVNTNMFAER